VGQILPLLPLESAATLKFTQTDNSLKLAIHQGIGGSNLAAKSLADRRNRFLDMNENRFEILLFLFAQSSIPLLQHPVEPLLSFFAQFEVEMDAIGIAPGAN
jgi:hypothetical protein